MSYIGIDPSVRATGLAYIRGGRKSVTHSWCVQVYPISEHWRISDLITEAWCEGVKYAIIETSFHGPNQRTTIQLAETRGRIIQMCYATHIKPILVSASEWQSAMLGGGKRVPAGETKARSIALAGLLLADVRVPTGKRMTLKPSDNAADAVGLCEYGRLNQLKPQ